MLGFSNARLGNCSHNIFGEIMVGLQNAAHSVINAVADRPRLNVLPQHDKLWVRLKIEYFYV